MSVRKLIAVVFLVIVTFTGCVSATGGLASQTTTVDGPSIDASIAPVSASALSSDWATILDACGIVYSLPGHDGKGLGTKVVSGIGLVAHARDIVKYAPIGPQPDIQNDDKAWVITTTGWTTPTLSDAANGIESLNATCCAVGDPSINTWVSTGGTRDATGVQPPLPFPAATLRLPPLLH